jgi:predicted GTPase
MMEWIHKDTNREFTILKNNFVKKVDLIITTSDYLNAEKKKLNPRSYVVKNGVDFKLFAPHSKKSISSNETVKG